MVRTSASFDKQLSIGFGRGAKHGFFTSSLSSLALGASVALVVLSVIATTSYFMLNRDRQDTDTVRQAHLERMQKLHEQQARERHARAKLLADRKARAQAVVERRMQKLARLQHTVKQREKHVNAALDRAKEARTINALRVADKEIITGSVKPVITSASGLRLGTLSGSLPLSHQNAQIDQFERSVSAAVMTKDTSTLGAFESALLRTELVQMKRLKFAHAKTTKKAQKLAAVLRKQGLKVPDDSAIGGPLIELKSGDKFLDTLGALDASLQQLASLRQLASRVPAGSPTPGQKISSRYGARTDPFTRKRAVHGGLDFKARRGVAVRATAGGVVTKAGRLGGYGKLVEIDHGNGVTTRYAHLSRITVSVGSKVTKGERVGKVGSTGRSTGPHLHYEVRRYGKTMDPLGFVNLGPKLRKFL